jgi:glycosyltransferase involved in cell wall biosynthesis
MHRRRNRRKNKTKPKNTEEKSNRTRPDIDEAKTSWENGNLFLDLADFKPPLPKVSVVTITKDRHNFFPLAVHNWKNFKYAEDLIEWVIVDDSADDSLRGLLPVDERIHYHHLKCVLPISDKRNYAVKKCTGTIIVHMDDDDYHFPDSIIAKVRVLMTYPEKQCAFSLPIGTYNIHNGASVIMDSEGDDIPEGSMIYYKKFWKESKFATCPEKNWSEWFGLCHNRWDKLISIPFWFNFIAFTHKKNATGSARFQRGSKNPQETPSFKKIFGDETLQIIRKIAQIEK